MTARLSARTAAQFLWLLWFLDSARLLQIGAAESVPAGEGPHSKPSRQWRIINLDNVAYGWAVSELNMYSDTKCAKTLSPAASESSKVTSDDPDKLTWTAISSGDQNAPARRAFDGLTWTEWRSECYMCKEGDAWIGLQFSKPVGVFCMSLYQWGKSDYMSARVMLQRWQEQDVVTGRGEWQDVMKGEGLGGEVFEEVSFTLCDELLPPDHGRVEISNGRFYPSEGTFSCSGARLMVGSDKQSCSADGTWPSKDPPTCWPAIALVILVASIFALETIAFGLYYVLVVMNKPPPLGTSTFIPDDALGKFTTDDIYGVREVEEDDGSEKRTKRVFTHVMLCFCCRVADTWHSVGQVPYFVGVWLPQMMLPCLPCIGTFVRMQIRQRFQIKGSISRDLMLWTCCIPCVATQEAKHVDHMCDVAEEEAVVMQKADERKKEKERKIREQIAEKNAAAGAQHLHGSARLGGDKVGKGHDHEDDDKHHHGHHKLTEAQLHMHPDFLRPKSVMDILTQMQMES